MMILVHSGLRRACSLELLHVNGNITKLDEWQFAQSCLTQKDSLSAFVDIMFMVPFIPFDQLIFNNYPAKSRGISSDT